MPTWTVCKHLGVVKAIAIFDFGCHTIWLNCPYLCVCCVLRRNNLFLRLKVSIVLRLKRGSVTQMFKIPQRNFFIQVESQACCTGCRRRPFQMKIHQQAKSNHSAKLPYLLSKLHNFNILWKLECPKIC